MHKDMTLLKLFISYSKDDIKFQKTLLKHLASLRDKIVTWNDQDMLPGEEWDQRIKDKLHSADVVLYLVSHNSIATDYIQNVELPLVIERCDNNECVLIPVIVDFCKWQHLYFAKYNALPNKGRPVTSWARRNEAWLNIVDGIERIIESSKLEDSVERIVIQEPKPVIIPSNLKTNEDWHIIDHYKVKDGLVFDTKTGLMWLRFSYGQTWQNGTVQGEAKKVSWENAFKAVEDFNANGGYFGYIDWRFPTIDELKTLIDKVKGKKGNYIHPDVFPNNSAVFWSSSPVGLGNYSWYVYFDSGGTGWGNSNDYGNQLRVVRSGQ
jgi:Protein of unknown function (DUF1566)/TIR domain